MRLRILAIFLHWFFIGSSQSLPNMLPLALDSQPLYTVVDLLSRRKKKDIWHTLTHTYTHTHTNTQTHSHSHIFTHTYRIIYRERKNLHKNRYREKCVKETEREKKKWRYFFVKDMTLTACQLFGLFRKWI